MKITIMAIIGLVGVMMAARAADPPSSVPTGLSVPTAGASSSAGASGLSGNGADSAKKAAPAAAPANCFDCGKAEKIFEIVAGAGLVLILAGSIFVAFVIATPGGAAAKAISEPSTEKPSASRIIAIMGLVALLPITLGFGYAIMWRIFTSQDLSNLPSPAAFLTAAAAVFAPYVANQISNALSK